MGCVASKLDINDVHPNMFAVNNVDDVSKNFSENFESHFFHKTITIPPNSKEKNKVLD